MRRTATPATVMLVMLVMLVTPGTPARVTLGRLAPVTLGTDTAGNLTPQGTGLTPPPTVVDLTTGRRR
jgi:hypothetical protein